MAVQILDGDGRDLSVPTADRDGHVIDAVGVRRRVRKGDPLQPGWKVVAPEGADEDAPRSGRRPRGKARTAPDESK
ncbi:MAG: hypothetical protein M0P31_18750 [Solirubrobacteraceae bacterium]|nr:hypothetical protein [Solirubrobacteraceae bacterium]